MTDQLRSLLEQAVPVDAPTLDPRAVADAARRSRNRSRAAVAGVAVLAVVGGTVLFAALDGRGVDRGHVADDGSSAPYDAPACPATLPELADARTSVDSLEGLTSVRRCPDLASPGLSVDTPTASEQRAILAGMDALVDDLPGFADRVAATEAFDPGRCATISVFNTRASLQLTFADGRQVLLPTPTCSPITVAGHQVDGGDLGHAFLAALDQQRDELAYRRPFNGPPTCEGELAGSGPARPGREDLVVAVHCTPDGASQALLSNAELTDLNAAWADATDVPADPDAREESTCTAPEQPPSYVVAGTDRSDVVRLADTGCGFLVWDGWRPGGAKAIPTTLARLGLTP